MEQLNQVLDQLINNFDFAYMLSINLLTYFIIKIIDYFNGDKKVKCITKRIVMILATIICCIIYGIFTEITTAVLINSTIAAPVFYSWIMKPILKKFNISYKI